jgi:hypothetical protein
VCKLLAQSFESNNRQPPCLILIASKTSFIRLLLYHFPLWQPYYGKTMRFSCEQIFFTRQCFCFWHLEAQLKFNSKARFVLAPTIPAYFKTNQPTFIDINNGFMIV